jgi:hypothetical protein
MRSYFLIKKINSTSNLPEPKVTFPYSEINSADWLSTLKKNFSRFPFIHCCHISNPVNIIYINLKYPKINNPKV